LECEFLPKREGKPQHQGATPKRKQDITVHAGMRLACEQVRAPKEGLTELSLSQGATGALHGQARQGLPGSTESRRRLRNRRRE
jgi:hypothetical protein